MLIRLLFILLCFYSAIPLSICNYIVEGKVNLNGNWQNEIYLATIDKLDDYYSASAKFIINTATIEEDGSFKIVGDNLPEQAQFYRLYLIKEEHSEFNACLFVDGEEHNFIHLILNNNSNINIQANPNAYAPFGDYEISGDEDNKLLSSLNRLIYPSYLFYEIKFPSELEFTENKLNRDLLSFADSCDNILISLAALINTNFDDYYISNQERYENFYLELKQKLPNHPYTKNYLRKLKYHRDEPNTDSIRFYKYLSVVLGFVCLFLLLLILRLLSRKPLAKKSLIDFNLTIQEEKVLKLIKEGKSNKEIASELFVELSTVKTHINKIYSKLKVKTRKEALNAIN